MTSASCLDFLRKAIDVVGDVQIQMVTSPSISRKLAPAPIRSVGHARLGGHIGECAVAVVAVEHVGSMIVEVDVQVTVVVVVGHRHAQSNPVSPTPACDVTSVNRQLPSFST